MLLPVVSCFKVEIFQCLKYNYKQVNSTLALVSEFKDPNKPYLTKGMSLVWDYLKIKVKYFALKSFALPYYEKIVMQYALFSFFFHFS